MRLIDADSFKRFLQALCKAGAPYYDVIQLLDKEPTAYDVSKVVAELEEETECPNCSMYCADAHICGFDEMRKQAISIVQEVAEEYKDIIPKKLYDALYAYKVDIRNDKNYVAS